MKTMNINFIASEPRARARQFDQFVGLTSDALADPVLSHDLGGIAAGLSLAVEELFLPNVSHGLATLPKDKTDSNGFAFMPVPSVSAKKPLFILDSSLLDQTPLRIAANAQSVVPDQGPVPLKGSNNKTALAVTTVHLGNVDAATNSTRFISRPVIVAKAELVAKRKLHTIVAGVMLHEISHGRWF
jgi:hypothetical protein